MFLPQVAVCFSGEENFEINGTRGRINSPIRWAGENIYAHSKEVWTWH